MIGIPQATAVLYIDSFGKFLLIVRARLELSGLFKSQAR